MAPPTSNTPPSPSKNEKAWTAFGGGPVLCAVVDRALLGAEPDEQARAFFEAGVDWIQLRDRSLEDRALWFVASQLVAARDAVHRQSPSSGMKRVVINKRIDLAEAAGADGAHLGFDAHSSATSRTFLGSHALLGRSLHTLREVEDAANSSIDYCHLAPIWDPLSKDATRPALGLDSLSAACRFGLPVFAQGGIGSNQAVPVIEAGAAGIAVTGILQSSGKPVEAIRLLRESLDHAAQLATD